ncbi:MAG: prolyl oligopeptidase family serine peptidase [Anaerolineae bacterium]|nr:prolyl oligopeptidase family serine peptidase [Anaerolineae bacterium]NIN97411.1 prolyl oligopeptidase family serine peptidase [Anaerolineae bacterium]NIQ80340.1 prolyl oligopeptidase family serine peptidase [Anaerolineae bacterium]
MVTLDGDDVYWLQIRPHEGGRYVITRRTPDGKISDVTLAPFNVRTRVHEYGGGDFLVSDRTVYFSNFVDQRLYRQEPGGEPTPITPEDDFRYADGVMDRLRRRLICVREDHTVSGEDAINSLVSIDLERPDAGRVMVSGNDFYSSPRLSPDGSRLAWLTWNHPNMPWDGTQLWVGVLEADGSLGRAELVCGGQDESIFQPEWSPDGVLHFVSDRTGWWNLYRRLGGGIEPLCEMEADFGYPQWVFGLSLYGFESPNRIICAYADQGVWRLASLGTTSGLLELIETPYTEIWRVRALPGRAVFAAGSPSEPPSLVELDVTTGQMEVLHCSSDVVIEEGYLTYPRAIEFPTEHGLTAHALYYPPQNRQYVAPAGERPPLIVMSHGGPTSSTWTTRRLEVQYWTSRGMGVLDVNYGGSTGYGRAYRERLKGRWGVVDVDDCVNGALHLVKGGEVDGDRLAIRGSSAGGYTTLCALTFRDVFSAGASYYGVSDVEALAKETHKFESRYLDSLIGPYPEQRELYEERSPIHFAERLSCPVIFFQGLEDHVVPPSQAELMVNALRAKGVPVAYIAFEGEQHGFRRAETIKRTLDAELYFYSRIFGFDLAEPVEPVPIENL